MKYPTALLLFATIVTMAYAQRPFYAGSRPIGYPDVGNIGSLSNRFGDPSNYPIEANGDSNFVNRMDRLPIDNRPFWYINAAQYDVIRKHPQTYEQRPNVFANTFNRLRKK